MDRARDRGPVAPLRGTGLVGPRRQGRALACGVRDPGGRAVGNPPWLEAPAARIRQTAFRTLERAEPPRPDFRGRPPLRTVQARESPAAGPAAVEQAPAQLKAARAAFVRGQVTPGGRTRQGPR